MKDLSIMQGVKILGEYKFISEGNVWAFYKESNGFYIYQYTIKKIYRESNQKLYDRVKEK